MTDNGFALIGRGLDMARSITASPATPSCRARTDRLQVAVDLPPPLHQIVVHLKPQEKSLGHAKIPRKPEVRIGRDISLAQHDLVDAARRDMNRPRQRVLAERHGLEKLLKQDFAGMRVVEQSGFRRGSRRFRHLSLLPSSHTKQIRHWSLILIECCPWRSAFNASKSIAGRNPK